MVILLIQKERVNTVDLFYLDLAKAFDSVKHGLLLTKHKTLGIDRNVLIWIKRYLPGRSYQVQIDDVLSDEAPCLIGFPQRPITASFIYE